MADIYRIGVKLAMTSNVAQILGVLGRDVLGFHARVRDLEGGLNRVKLAMAGAIAIGAGAALAASFKSPIEKAMEFEQTVARFKQFGLSAKLNADMVEFAKNTNIAGTTYTEMMRNIIEAQGIFRESGLSGQEAVAGAKMMAPIMAKIDFNERILGAKGGDTKDLLKFVESRGGANNEALARKWSDIAYKLSQSSGGIVNYSSLRQFGAAVGTLGNNLSETGIVKLEPVLSDLGGGTAGSGFRVANQRLLGTQRGLPVQAIHEMLALNLWDATKVELKKGGGIQKFLGTPGAVLRDSALLQSDPVAYYQTKFLPAIAQKYGAWILGSTEKAITARSVEEALVFGPGTASKLFGQIDKLAPAISKSPSAYAKQAGIDRANDLAKGTTAGKFADAQAKFNNLMISYGSAILPLVNRTLGLLLPKMQSLATWMNAHASIVKAVAMGVLVLSGALVAAGAVALAIAAGPIALWTAGIGLLSAVVVGVVDYFTNFNGVLTFLKGAVLGLLGPFGSFLNLIGLIHWPGSQPSPIPAPQQPQPQINPIAPAGKMTMVHGVVYIDGKPAGKILAPHVTNEQAKAAGRPNTGQSGFNPGYSLIQPVSR